MRYSKILSVAVLLALTACTHKIELSEAKVDRFDNKQIHFGTISYRAPSRKTEQIVLAGQAQIVVFSASSDLVALSEKLSHNLSAFVFVCSRENRYFYGDDIYQRDIQTGRYSLLIPTVAELLMQRQSDGGATIGWPIHELADQDVCLEVSGGDMVTTAKSNHIVIGSAGEMFSH